MHTDGGANGQSRGFVVFKTGGPVAAPATNRTLDRLSLKDDGVAEDIKNVVADCLCLNRLARRQVPVCRLPWQCMLLAVVGTLVAAML